MFGNTYGLGGLVGTLPLRRCMLVLHTMLCFRFCDATSTCAWTERVQRTQKSTCHRAMCGGIWRSLVGPCPPQHIARRAGTRIPPQCSYSTRLLVSEGAPMRCTGCTPWNQVRSVRFPPSACRVAPRNGHCAKSAKLTPFRIFR